MNKVAIILLTIAFAATALHAGTGHQMHDTSAIEYAPDVYTEDMHISRGGQLYDNWWRTTVNTEKPEGDHPLWKTQSRNTRSGYSTYRCKECHGWDYRGKDGAYSKGSHYTGFKGIYTASKKMTNVELESTLRGSTTKEHDFSIYLSNADISDLALFMKKGLIDLTKFINTNGIPVGGNPESGQAIFMNNCMHQCHGRIGTVINFGDKEKPEFVGTIANKNPWEFIHKARAGQPGTKMTSGIINKWSSNDIRDLLSFARTLPKELPEPGWFNRMMRKMGWGEQEWTSHEHGRGFGPLME